MAFIFQTQAQNAIVGPGFSNGWGGGSCPTGTSNLNYLGSSVGTSFGLQTTANGTGWQYFRFAVNWSGVTSQLAIAHGTDLQVYPNTTYSLNTNCTTSGAQYIDVSNASYNYIFKTLNAGTSPTGTFTFFEVQGAVRSVSSVTQLPTVANVTVGVPTIVTANLDGTLATGQGVYLRYTSNNYANSVVVPMTGSGATYTATIPGAVNAMSANVSYYVFTSGTNNVAPDGSNADFYTINLNNNGGPNYTYTVTNNVVTWNGTSWSNGVGPSAQSEAILTGAYNSGAAEGVFTASKVTINTGGSLTIASGTNITVTNEVVNNLTETAFVIENNGNLIQTNDVSNTGSATVLRMSAPIKRLDYTLWSSPVGGQMLKAFSPGTVFETTPTLVSRFYTFDPLAIPLGGTSGQGAYVSVTDPVNTPFSEGNGYLIRASNFLSDTNVAPWLGTYKGVPHNGNVTLTTTSGYWYAVGNPYPSTIDADEFITANSLTQPLYFWRKTNGSTSPSYATYTLVGQTGVGAPNTGGGSTITPDGTIAVGQGFIAQATSTSLVFTNALRNGDISTQFLRTASNNKSRVWLNLTNNQGFVNQMLVGYMSSATTGIDDAIDGRFFENNIPTQLSSLINGEEFAVQGRPDFAATDVVAIGFKAQTEGNYTIAIDHVDGLFSNGQNVFLKDNVTNTVHNLTNEPYNFTAPAGTSNTRFEIVYQSTLATQNAVFNENMVTVYKQNQSLVVNSGTVEMESVKVYDIQGRLLVEQNDVKSTTAKVALATTNQVLIVKVTAKDSSVITKKVLF